MVRKLSYISDHTRPMMQRLNHGKVKRCLPLERDWLTKARQMSRLAKHDEAIQRAAEEFTLPEKSDCHNFVVENTEAWDEFTFLQLCTYTTHVSKHLVCFDFQYLPFPTALTTTRAADVD